METHPATPLPDPRAARLAKGYSVRALAKLAGIGSSTVSRCERDGTWPEQLAVRRAYLAALELVEPPAPVGTPEVAP